MSDKSVKSMAELIKLSIIGNGNIERGRRLEEKAFAKYRNPKLAKPAKKKSKKVKTLTQLIEEQIYGTKTKQAKKPPTVAEAGKIIRERQFRETLQDTTFEDYLTEWKRNLGKVKLPY